MSANSEVLAQVNSTKGMGSLNSDQFELALIELISDYLCDDFITPVIACGMVGAKQGWKEAGYISVPAEPPKSTKFTQPNVNDPRIAVYILPGMSQSMPADVMRGEETQISGYLAQNPNFNGSICLPGTHTKWVQISAGEVVSFRTFMTGELFNIISKHSVLRHSVDEGWDEEAFIESVSDGMMNANMLTNNAVWAACIFTFRRIATDKCNCKTLGDVDWVGIGWSKGILVGQSSCNNWWQQDHGPLSSCSNTTGCYAYSCEC